MMHTYASSTVGLRPTIVSVYIRVCILMVNNLIIALDLIILKPQAKPMLLHRLSAGEPLTTLTTEKITYLLLLIFYDADWKTSRPISRGNGAPGVARCTTARAPSTHAADNGERRRSAGFEIQTKSGSVESWLQTIGVHEAAEIEPLRRGR